MSDRSHYPLNRDRIVMPQVRPLQFGQMAIKSLTISAKIPIILNIFQGDTMSEITLNPDQLKEILKSAIVELLRENRGEVSEFLTELIEDVAMERARGR
ncbi:MAG TPA: hypothetical protein VK211_20985 [Kamptonema sp.]|nr:hypothetical protein [Kamptonema sp.]